ncbi:NAD-dependent epimerase/dehydratase family protein [Bacillus sp. Marseille-P3661]|uniref:NAD-dependent epimerase/dehydratase family protein n=1 Tax=Bacillus sp. Marseille-P3661 TaxID=1936234 RepID=UPI002155BE8E|nr:NAD-dependent epimerase/dehydratase family protein [Bacillus sp. Marseille-P3661]
MDNSIIKSDMEYIMSSLDPIEKDRFQDSVIVITGCAGFLGLYFLQFFISKAKELGIRSIIGMDNFLLGKPKWLSLMEKNNEILNLYQFDIAKDDMNAVPGLRDATFIVHMASIASPVFYRKYPVETIDANIWGLRKLLDYYKSKKLKGFLFFSSSEVYGDPLPENIPTTEDYRGNVSSTGPRSCYDEAKRFGETMCYVFANLHQMPITIVRPFNNYGPGMKLGDRRIPADFAKAVMENQDLIILSDGTPTRTFCYVTDAIVGYIKALIYGEFEIFNIGIDTPEISMRNLADIYANKGKEIMNYAGTIKFDAPIEKDYLMHNPFRRCPDISKAKQLLKYNPRIQVNEGVSKFLEFLKISEGTVWLQ